MIDAQEISILLQDIKNLKNNAQKDVFIDVLGVIVSLMGECSGRATKATYVKDFKLGKLNIKIEFDGMR